MIISVDSELWNSIYYNIRDHLLEDFPGTTWHGSVNGWLEQRFMDHGIRLLNDRSSNGRAAAWPIATKRVWTHVEISDDIDTVELMLRWG